MSIQHIREAVDVIYDWSKAPEWAEWYAADRASGVFYEEEPVPMKTHDVWGLVCGKFEIHHELAADSPNWRATLQKRP